MIEQARKRRIDKFFELEGHVYAFDSTIIDLCLSMFGLESSGNTREAFDKKHIRNLFDKKNINDVKDLYGSSEPNLFNF